MCGLQISPEQEKVGAVDSYQFLSRSGEGQVGALFPVQRGVGDGGPRDLGSGEVSKVDTTSPQPLWVQWSLCHL